jgi:hypothetical protein
MSFYDTYPLAIEFFKAQIHLVFRHFSEDETLLSQYFLALQDEEATLVNTVFTQTEWGLMKTIYEKTKFDKELQVKVSNHSIKL